MTDHGASIVDRYVHAVRCLLPRNQRDDIASELRAILQSQLDDEETLRQRPLSDDEVREILREYGHPRKVASGYGSRRYLIGPEVFPYYVMGVKFVLGLMGVITLFMVLLTAFMSENRFVADVADTLGTMVVVGIVNLAIVTFVFASVGSMAAWRDDPDWNPEDLPDPDPPALKRSDVIGSLVSLTFLLAWWLGINRLLWQWVMGLPLPFGWTGVWADVYYAAIGVILACIAREVFGLIRPWKTKLYAGLGVTLDLFAVFILVRLLRAGTYFTATDAAASGPGSLLVRFLDKTLFVALLMGTVAVTINIVKGMVGLLRVSRLTPSRQH
jgi:hypothetical protein